jgi:CAAX protease family protein
MNPTKPFADPDGAMLREVLAPALLVIALVAMSQALVPVNQAAAGVLSAAATLTMFWWPVLVLTAARRDFAAYGLTTAGWLRGLRLVGLAAAVVLPLFVTGYFLFWGALAGKTITPGFGRSLAWEVPWQFLVIALPEEVFFRGYLQTNLTRLFPGAQRRWIGGQGPAIVLTSAIFAIVHVAPSLEPMRAAVFFPSLVFGFLRARTGSVVAPIAFHALANLVVFVLEGTG